MRPFCHDLLTKSGGGTFFIVGLGRPQVGVKWAFAQHELGYTPSKPEVNRVNYCTSGMTLTLHKSKFAVLVSCHDELLAVHACPFICLQRQVAMLVNGLFYYWPLLRNNNMATNL